MDLSIIQKSDTKIIKKIGMADLPLILFTLNIKYNGEYSLIDIGNDCMFRYGNTNVGNVSYLATFIHFIAIEDDCIIITGNISWPSVIKEKLHFYAKNSENPYECELKPGVLNRFTNDGELFEIRDIFEVRIPLNQGYNEISFIYECNGIHSTSGKINSMRHCPVSDVLPRQYAEVNGWLMNIRDGKLRVEKNDPKGVLGKILESTFLTEIEDREVKSLREKYFIKCKDKKRPIWLFMDGLEKADDNGEAFFRYVSENELDIDTYFVISKNSPDFTRLKKYGNVIPAMSETHFLLLFMADYIFTSQLSGWVENPFPKKEEYFRDLYHRARVVFLQHGITIEDHSKRLNNIKQNLFAIVTSSEIETKDLERPEYGYKKENIWNVGMPSFDLLYKDTVKYVLILPAQRSKILKQKYFDDLKTYKWVVKEGEEYKSYFETYNSLLSNNEFKALCRKNNLEPAILVHPMMMNNSSLFQIPEDVTMLSYTSMWREFFAQSAVIITDYSSATLDFAYLGRPIIYYQFDKDSFAENNRFEKGYFDYETMGFGEVVNKEEELINCIRRLFDNEVGIDEKYSERITNYFTYIDNQNRNRLLDRIKETTFEK